MVEIMAQPGLTGREEEIQEAKTEFTTQKRKGRFINLKIDGETLEEANKSGFILLHNH